MDSCHLSRNSVKQVGQGCAQAVQLLRIASSGPPRKSLLLSTLESAVSFEAQVRVQVLPSSKSAHHAHVSQFPLHLE